MRASAVTFGKELEGHIKGMLENTTDLELKVKLIEAGIKLLAIKHNPEPPDDEERSFFSKRRRGK